MPFNINEMILDRVRSLTTHDLSTGELLFRLTSLEDPSLSCTAEGEEVTDAIGSLITTIYRAKKATFSASNSLISLDLAAAQYGTKKETASSSSKIVDYAYEVLPVSKNEDEDTYYVTLKNAARTITDENGQDVTSIKYIYVIENGQIGTAYKCGSAVSATEFAVDTDNKKIKLPTAVTSGKIYVEYEYESENAMKVTNRASQFPSACSMIIYAYFKDVCNENTVYSGKIICPKAKLNPEQVELALTSTGKHAFEFQMMKDYCADETEDELFSIIISQ